MVSEHIPLLLAMAVGVLSAIAESLHTRRTRRVAPLAFGPTRTPRSWAQPAPLVRMAAITAATWGLATLAMLPPKVHQEVVVDSSDARHIVLVLDVSPSMRLDDAGPTGKQPRLQRVANLMRSFFQRVPMQQYRVSIVAVYSGAKQVVVDTKDMEVVWNILEDLPMHHAFRPGKTELFSGLAEAASLAKTWNPGSTHVIVLSDGDTVPPTGMPQMPAAVSAVLVVGVGDPLSGAFIDGHRSRQESLTLRQIALRLQGTYYDGNQKQIPSDTIAWLTAASQPEPIDEWSQREYALLATACGAFVLALLPVSLHYFGSAWRPGIYRHRAAADRLIRRQTPVRQNPFIH